MQLVLKLLRLVAGFTVGLHCLSVILLLYVGVAIAGVFLHIDEIFSHSCRLAAFIIKHQSACNQHRNHYQCYSLQPFGSFFLVLDKNFIRIDRSGRIIAYMCLLLAQQHILKRINECGRLLRFLQRIQHFRHIDALPEPCCC
ncbi:hypothetical protein D3C78_1097140 [compost metagenome]